MLQKIKNILPLILIAFIAWMLYKNWIFANPSNIIISNVIEAKDVKISSRVSGRLSKIYIQEGSQVKKGQILLELEADELIAQLEQAKALLKKSEMNLKDLSSGSRIQEKQEAKAKNIKAITLLDESKLKHDLASVDFARIKELYKEGAVSKQKYDSYETQKNLAEKEIKAAEQEKTIFEESESLTLEGPRKDQIKALSAEVEYQKAKVRELSKYVDELNITSPLNGEITSFDLKTGELIKVNQNLLTICDLSDLYTRVYIPSTKLSKIMINQKVDIKADSYPESIFEGLIVYIGAQAEYTPRNVQTAEERTKLVYPVKIKIKNNGNKLRDGMYITVKL